MDLQALAKPITDELAHLGDATLVALPRLGIALVVLVVATLIGRAAAAAVRAGSGRFGHHESSVLASVLGRLTRLGVHIVGALVAIAIVFPSFTPANLVQLLGISSVAIGFAFRDIFQNFLAGLLLLVTRPFRIGDQIAFAGYEGTVEDIQTRATLLRTYDDRRIVIPNASLFTTAVTVNTAYPQRRMEHDLDLPAGRDLAATRDALRVALAGVAGVLSDPPPDVLLTDLPAAGGAKLRARWWIEPPRTEDAMVARSRALEALRDALAPPAEPR